MILKNTISRKTKIFELDSTNLYNSKCIYLIIIACNIFFLYQTIFSKHYDYLLVSISIAESILLYIITNKMNLKQRMQQNNKNNSSIINNSNYDFAQLNKEDQIYERSRREC